MATKKTKETQVYEVNAKVKNKDGRTAIITAVYADGVEDGEGQGKKGGPKYGVRVYPTDRVPGMVSGIWDHADIKDVTETAPAPVDPDTGEAKE